MLAELTPPFDGETIVREKRRLLRILKEQESGAVPLKIAVLGGSTTSDIVKILELFLRDRGIAPTFWESEYAQYKNDALFDNPALNEFAPEMIFIHTSSRNIENLPLPLDSAEQSAAKLDAEYSRFELIWERLFAKYSCPIIQNNFELPLTRAQGNREAGSFGGTVDFITRLNCRFYDYARAHKNFYIHDVNYLSATYGLDKWLEPRYWHLYKYSLCVPAIPLFAHSLSNIVCSLMGKNKKLLALDLDNTLWGGVIGDDGVAGIDIGQETPVGQGFYQLQSYVRSLKDIGVLLAVCSKNDRENAIEGLNHPDGALRPDDFVCIKANWDEKSRNIADMSQELNLLPESFVFVDDNPAEREIVRAQLPSVSVPDFDGVEDCILKIDRSGFFEVTTLSADDAARAEMYRENAQRAAEESKFASYGEFLESLDMHAKIRDFDELSLPRITQLTNKSNQFNVTTKRYTSGEMEQAAADENRVRLYGRLCDKFGDNGIVSVVIGERRENALHIELWLMSCRVLKRDMEYAMLDELVKQCQARGIEEIYGYYYPTKKNAMVKELFGDFGFEKQSEDEGGNTVWRMKTAGYSPKNNVIKVNEEETDG